MPGIPVTQDLFSLNCFSYEMVTTNGVWGTSILSDFSLPVFLIYAIASVATSQALAVFFQRFRQPRVIAEIITGIIWGPTLAGQFLRIKYKRTDYYTLYTQNMWAWNIFETAAHLGLFLYIFLVGVDMDVNLLKRTIKKSFIVATAGMLLPFIVAAGAAFMFADTFYLDSKLGKNPQFLAFVCLLLATTSFPVVTRILAELKLLNTDFGRTAFCAAMINDIVAWGVLPAVVAGMEMVSEKVDDTPAGKFWKFAASMVGLVAICGFCVRPVVWWIQRQTPEGESVSNSHISMLLGGALLCGFLSDGVGVHYLFGGFAFGLAIPSGPVATAIGEMLEDFVVTLLLPMYFTLVGVHTDFTVLFSKLPPQSTGPSSAIIIAPVLAGAAKIGGTVLASVSLSMPMNEALSLGFLMNCKCLIEIMVLDLGRIQPVFQTASFVVLVLSFFFMTMLVSPAVAILYKPSKVRPLIGYKRRNLQRSKPDTELRMLTCVHHARNVPAILSLLEVSNPTKRSPIFVYALHLVELTGRASAMLIHHGNANDRISANEHKTGYGQSEHIITAFEAYEQHAGGVSMQPLTAIAAYPTMDEDVCSVAGDKRTAIIILPFHKQLAVDGTMEEIHPAIRGLNERILDNAPCSVGILIDRGMSDTARYAGGKHHNVAVLFFGGPDDREALAYGWRIADHPGITVTLVRFVLGEGATVVQTVNDEEEGLQAISILQEETEREKQMDDEYISEFRLRYVSDESVMYMEKVVNSSEDTVAAIRQMEGNHDLYVVGRGCGMATPLLEGLTGWSEIPELGPIGDLLASTDFGMTVSVLVVQQYVERVAEVPMPESPGKQGRQYLSTGNNKVKSWVRTDGGYNQGWNGIP